MHKRKEQGIAIVMAIIFLLVLTILCISTTNTSFLAEKMSQNMKDMTTAFEAAESALSDGEQWLKSQATSPSVVSSCTSTPCNVVWQSSVLPTLSAQTNSWWQTNGQLYSATIANAASQPRFIVELLGFTTTDLSPTALASGTGQYYFRVTARGVGRSNNSVVNLQSIYLVQY